MFQPMTHEPAVARMAELGRQTRKITRRPVRHDLPARPGYSGRALRERAGRALIHIGLRLAGSPAVYHP